MPNDYNVTMTNLAKDDNKFFLFDPAVYVKLQGEEDTSLEPLGYMEVQKAFKGKVSYAKFSEGIPKTEIRRDPIEQEFSFEGKLKQIQKETLALIMRRRVDTTTGDDWDRVIIGTNLPPQLFLCLVLIGQTVDGEEVRLYIRRFQIAAEDLEVALGADDYASIPFSGIATKDEHPLVNNPDWDFIGTVEKASCGTTSGDATVTIAATTGIVAGQYVIGDGVPANTTVLSVTENTSIELSANATATGTVTLLFEDLDATYADQDNIAFWAFARPA